MRGSTAKYQHLTAVLICILTSSKHCPTMASEDKQGICLKLIVLVCGTDSFSVVALYH